MTTKMVGIKFTEEEIEALDYLVEVMCAKSRSDMIRDALRLVKPTFVVNPFNARIVKSSRADHSPRRRSRRPNGKYTQTAPDER